MTKTQIKHRAKIYRERIEKLKKQPACAAEVLAMALQEQGDWLAQKAAAEKGNLPSRGTMQEDQMEIENCACGGLAACCPKCGGQVLPVVDVTWVPQIHDYRELMRRYECFRCGLRGPDHHRDRVAWRRFKRLARSMRRMKED